MGVLKETIALNLLAFGNGLADNYKNNSLFFYNKLSKSDEDVKNIPISSIVPGGFYFLHYLDDSNWMKYSPIFAVEYKKFKGLIVLLAINFNFIPIQVRGYLFDKYITQEDIDQNRPLKVDYEGVYRELFKLGFEYALVEYNLEQVKYVHNISMSMVPRFLYSGHPINKYDPEKLMQIWKAKISTKEKRHQEMLTAVLEDFYEVEKDFTQKYDQLTEHINRIQKSMEKYGTN